MKQNMSPKDFDQNQKNKNSVGWQNNSKLSDFCKGH